MTGKCGRRLTMPYWQPLTFNAIFPLLFPNFPEPYHRGIQLSQIEDQEEHIDDFDGFI